MSIKSPVTLAGAIVRDCAVCWAIVLKQRIALRQIVDTTDLVVEIIVHLLHPRCDGESQGRRCTSTFSKSGVWSSGDLSPKYTFLIGRQIEEQRCGFRVWGLEFGVPSYGFWFNVLTTRGIEFQYFLPDPFSTGSSFALKANRGRRWGLGGCRFRVWGFDFSFWFRVWGSGFSRSTLNEKPETLNPKPISSCSGATLLRLTPICDALQHKSSQRIGILCPRYAFEIPSLQCPSRTHQR